MAETVRLFALTFNEKAMIALTKDKYRLALQNLVKACRVRGELICDAGSACAIFTLYANCSFCLYKLDKVAESITFCN